VPGEDVAVERGTSVDKIAVVQAWQISVATLQATPSCPSRPHKSKHKRLYCDYTSVRSCVVLGAFLLAFLSPVSSFAQTLDQRVNALLANNCTDLGTGGPNVLNTVGFGTKLLQLCTSPQQGSTSQSASTTGGGGASVQGSAASILNRTLLGRLEDLKNEDRENTDQTSSMLVNPLGVMSMAQMANMVNVSSPFYAATSTGGDPVAAFGTSTKSRWKGLGFFASGLVESLNRDITTFQDGYKSRILGFSVGMDYRVSRNVVTGFAGSFSNADGDFRSGGTFSTNSYGFLAFAQILPTEKTFIQVTAGYTRNNYQVSRLATAQVTISGDPPGPLISTLASSNSNGDVASAGFLAGYDHAIGRFLVGPRVGMNYGQTHIGSYAEKDRAGIGLAYDGQNIHSMQSIVGLFGSTAYSTRFGVLVHQINADYVHEFANSQRSITVQFADDLRGTPAFPGTTPTKFTFQNEVPARNYAYLGTGLVAVLPNGWQPFVNFRAMVGNEQFNNYAGTFGLRIEL
jgi:uncharacterized protein YhjY with autotransporter beta-barrel domain